MSAIVVSWFIPIKWFSVLNCSDFYHRCVSVLPNVIKLSRWLRSCTVILFWGKKTMTLMKLLKRNTYKPGMLN